MMSLNSSAPNISLVEVIIVYRSEGHGTEECPVRSVRYIHSVEGELLGRLDDAEEINRIAGRCCRAVH